MTDFADRRVVNDEIVLGRNSPDEFYRILRKSQNYENANTRTFGDRKAYTGGEYTKERVLEQVALLQSNPVERYRPKTDRMPIRDNISDEPGFGSVRLSPPYENASFDREYFAFIDSLIHPEYAVADFGGGGGMFLGLLRNCAQKYLVEKNNAGDIPELGVAYRDADAFDSSFDAALCYHTLEHVDEPERMLTRLAESKRFSIFATPNRELIETSINHYVLVELPILVEHLTRIGKPAFIHLSNGGLDIHCMIISDKKVFSEIKDNPFFVGHWAYYTNFA